VGDVVKEFQSYGVNLLVHDSMADSDEAQRHYNTRLCDWSELSSLDAIVLCVSHKQYTTVTPKQYKSMLNDNGVFMDVKSTVDRRQFLKNKINLWRL
jgi:UDP-N-acetyl-D-galactosamine dehydrogenase